MFVQYIDIPGCIFCPTCFIVLLLHYMCYFSLASKDLAQTAYFMAHNRWLDVVTPLLLAFLTVLSLCCIARKHVGGGLVS